MTTAFRIAKRKYAGDSLGGRGGLVAGGRWHHTGIRVVYCAASSSLAALEYFVHFGKRQNKLSLVFIEVGIPDEVIERLANRRLPQDWRQVPPPRSTADIGTAWLKRGRTAVLRVPSIQAPKEHNYLINPSHADAARIKVKASVAYSFDPRMWK